MHPRNASLDLLRALAILMVLATHIANSFARGTPLANGLSVGGRGVDLFFVLSGWLLGSQLFREVRTTGSVDVKRFWIRRWLRTLPAYYTVLLATFAQLIVQGKANLIDWRYLVFLQNYLPEMPYLGVTWSLCVEEHFYLAIAPAILFAYRYRWAFVLVALTVVALIVAHILGYYTHRADYHIRETHVVFVQCLTGVMLAGIAEFWPRTWHVLRKISGLWALLSLLLILVAAWNRTYGGWTLPDWGTGGWALLFAGWIVLANSSAFWRTKVKSRAISFVAMRAYSIYLVHTEAIRAAEKLHVLPAEWQGILAVALAFAGAEILYRAVERPCYRLRDRWSKPHHSSPSSSSGSSIVR